MAFRARRLSGNVRHPTPSAIGNPNLKPETDTWKPHLSGSPMAYRNWELNLYQYQMKDVLRFVPNSGPTTSATAQGKQRGRGFELEGIRAPVGQLFLSVRTRKPIRMPAWLRTRKVYLRGDWRVVDDWALNAQYNWLEQPQPQAVR